MQVDVFSWTITSAHYIYNWLILSLPKTWLKNDLTKDNLRVVEKQRERIHIVKETKLNILFL